MPDGSRYARPADSAVLTLPNIITFLRLCAVPVAVWLVLHEAFLSAFTLFVAAGLSDALDGWLARRMGGTALGRLIDPAADKALLVSMYITLAAVRVLPDWLAILVVFRDVMIVGGSLVLWAAGMRVSIRPLLVSKANTVLQIVLVATALLVAGHDIAAGGWFGALIWLVAASTLASGAGYVLRGIRSGGAA